MDGIPEHELRAVFGNAKREAALVRCLKLSFSEVDGRSSRRRLPPRLMSVGSQANHLQICLATSRRGNRLRNYNKPHPSLPSFATRHGSAYSGPSLESDLSVFKLEDFLRGRPPAIKTGYCICWFGICLIPGRRHDYDWTFMLSARAAGPPPPSLLAPFPVTNPSVPYLLLHQLYLLVLGSGSTQPLRYFMS